MNTRPAAVSQASRYRALSNETLPAYLGTVPGLAEHLGGKPASWKVKEVGDGNLNLVFIVESAAGSSLVVKQALPYLRLVGEGWPLPLSRAFFEHEALVEQDRHVPGAVPKVFHFDEELALIVMERLSPHLIMRKGLIAGSVYPKFAGDIGRFLARTLFFTSDLAMTAEAKRARGAVFAGNHVLCNITEDLVFTEPFQVAPRNRWTSPFLDGAAQSIREDGELKHEVFELKRLFLTSAEALVHGDLHTGSIMLTKDDTRVIDPEFAFYGPMGFDAGAVIGNLLLAYFAQEGHASAKDDRVAYREWILAQVREAWAVFTNEFVSLWNAKGTGDGAQGGHFTLDAEAGPNDVQRAYLDRVFRDAVGFAGVKMIRRILGLAHVEDLESIADPALRARCEEKALAAATTLVTRRRSFATIGDAVEAVVRVDATR